MFPNITSVNEMKLKTVKDRLKDETLDLSLCDLSDVPVREIASVRKATHLDLSNNLLLSLPSTFVTLKQIVKLDLSKNMLTEIPENFGEMKQLKHLDLYANQISRLPLSLSELKNLRWLDLKENPLTPAVASVAGPCSNSSECQACARNIVAYLLNVKVTIAEEKLRRLNAALDVESASLKKGEKKKKKKSIEKGSKKTLAKNGSKTASQVSLVSKTKDEDSLPKYYGNANKENGLSKGKFRTSFIRTFFIMALWTLLPCLAVAFAVLIFPLYSKEKSELFVEYVETHTGVSLKPFQKQGTETLQHSLEIVTAWTKSIYKYFNDIYEKHFSMNVNVPGNVK